MDRLVNGPPINLWHKLQMGHKAPTKLGTRGLANVQQHHRFAGLDALRGCAAICVVLFHAHQIFDSKWLMPSGYMAVDLFFVISGVVVAYAYERRLPAIGVTRFVAIRAIRFYPLYVLGLSIGLVRAGITMAAGRPVVAATDLLPVVVSALIFLPAGCLRWSVQSVSPLNGAAWSLIVELWINVIYAATLRWLTNKLLATIVCLAGLWIVLLYGTGLNGAGGDMTTIHVGFARGLYSFPLGVLMYRLMGDRNWVNLRWEPVGLVTALLLMMPSSSISATIYTLILSPLTVLIAMQAKANTRVAEYLGVTSYCLYAIHSPVLQLAGGATNRLGISPLWTVAVPIAAILILAPTLDARLDRPIRNWLAERFGRVTARS